MNPMIFKEANRKLLPPNATYSDDVDHIASVSIWSNGEQCVSCWKMSFKERLAALIFGRVWVAVLSGETQPPIYVQASKEYFKEVEDEPPQPD